jgi:hypothetical protein
MFKKILCSLLLMGLFASAGCTQKLDESLLLMRQEAAANEKLYGGATQKFADVADQIARQKIELQRMVLEERTSRWLDKHTVNGTVTATPAEMATMLSQRDVGYGQLAASESTWAQTVSDFRRMISDKLVFSSQIFAKEIDAQRAKDEMLKAGNSLVKTLMGAGTTAAIALPLAF